MVVVTGREFRSSQTKYLNYASQGEDVILKSRHGNFRIIPVATNDTAYDDTQLDEMLERAFDQAQKGEVLAKKEDETIDDFLTRMICTD